MDKNQKTPEVRFKGFREDWVEKMLEDETEIVAGGDIDNKKILTSGKYPVFANALSNTGIIGYYENQYRIEAPAVTVTGRGDVGHAQARNIHFTPVVRLLAIKSPHNNCFLENAINNLHIVVESTGVPQLTVPQLKKYSIFFPSYDEQTAIGKFFSTVDCLIAQKQRQHDKTVNMKKACLEKMFPKPGAKVPEVRFAGFREDWNFQSLEEAGVNLFSGLTYSPENVVSNIGTLVIRSSNVKNGEIMDADNVYVEPNVVNCDNVQIGDVIIVVRNGSRNLIGKHALIKHEMKNTVIGAFMSGVRSDHPEFINALFDTEYFDFEIAKNLGATINQITNGMFKKMYFPFPNEPTERVNIGAFFQQLDKLIALYAKELEKLKNIKKACLDKMFV